MKLTDRDPPRSTLTCSFWLDLMRVLFQNTGNNNTDVKLRWELLFSPFSSLYKCGP